MMDVQGKSDLPIVPLKPSNDAAVAAAETGEGRGGAKGNAVQGGTRQTQGWESVQNKLLLIHQKAKMDKKKRIDFFMMRDFGLTENVKMTFICSKNHTKN